MIVLKSSSPKIRKYADPKTIEWFEKLKKTKWNKVNDAELQKFFAGLDEDLIADLQQEALELAAERGQQLTFKEIQVLWKRGNDFNTRAKLDEAYLRNEIWLEHPSKLYPKGHKNAGNPKRFRLDSWDPDGAGKIVSRKATDLDKIKPETFERYLKEIEEKYPIGSKPANSTYGDKLNGDYYLEIPESNSSFEKIVEYQEIAVDKYNVTIIFRAE